MGRGQFRILESGIVIWHANTPHHGNAKFEHYLRFAQLLMLLAVECRRNANPWSWMSCLESLGLVFLFADFAFVSWGLAYWWEGELFPVGEANLCGRFSVAFWI